MSKASKILIAIIYIICFISIVTTLVTACSKPAAKTTLLDALNASGEWDHTLAADTSIVLLYEQDGIRLYVVTEPGVNAYLVSIRDDGVIDWEDSLL